MSGGVALVANTPVSGVKLTMAPQAVLAGRVLDNEGDPLMGAQVSLLTSRVMNGLRGIQAANSTNTNDLGEYRFAGLEAGKYILCVNAGGGGIGQNVGRAYGEKCYPGPMDAAPASALDVAAGFEGRFDFSLSPLATVRVSGVIPGMPEGGGVSVNLTPRTQIARMYMGLSAPVRPDGTFVIRNVPPGSYTINATSNQGGRRLSARAPLEAGGGDVEGIQLRLEPGLTISGTIKVVSTTGRKIEKPQYSAIRSTG